MSNLGNQIRDARKASSLSQTDVAGIVGVTQGIVSHWERGTASPDERQLAVLRKKIGLKASANMPAKSEPKRAPSGKSKRGRKPRGVVEAGPIAARIKQARIEQSLNQTQVADKIGVSNVYVSLWERGKGTLKTTELASLERILGISLSKESQRETERGSDGDAAHGSSIAFGRWLQDARRNASLTVSELAEISGVSHPQIYNIESGKSSNPRQETRNKLEKALNENTPEEIVESSEASGLVEGLGGITDFEPHDKSDWPTVPGIYVFYDISDRPIYVGKADNIARRVKDHEEKFWFKAPIVNNAAYIEIKDDTLRHQVEQILIKFLKSNAVINKQGVVR